MLQIYLIVSFGLFFQTRRFRLFYCLVGGWYTDLSRQGVVMSYEIGGFGFTRLPAGFYGGLTVYRRSLFVTNFDFGWLAGMGGVL